MRRLRIMDHSEASRLMAFEEHLFACHECAMDVRAGSAFLEHSKAELANFSPRVERRAAEVRPSRGFAWWRPALAIPAMAILLIVVGYQNLVTYPAMKGALAENKAPRILPAVSLVSAVTRGSPPSVIAVRAGEPFLL